MGRLVSFDPLCGASQYTEFLKRAFDALELMRSSSPDGRLLNASVGIANSLLMLNDVSPNSAANVSLRAAMLLTLYLPDTDASRTKALCTGRKVVSSIRDQFWEDRYGELAAPFGFAGAIATLLEDLAAAEIEARRRRVFGAGPAYKA